MTLVHLSSRAALVSLALILASSVARAQSDGTRDTVAEARSHRDAGRLERAVRVLRPYVAAHPEEAEAARILGETQYWLKDGTSARATFESAIARHPSNAELRLTYGQMLVETGDHARARQLLDPLVGTSDSRGRAETRLGIAAYWAGDHSAARRLLAAALDADAAIPEARAALREILLATAPRVQASGHALSDDQPLQRTGIRLAGKAFATPLIGVSAQVEPTRLRLDNGVAATLTFAEGGVSAFVPALRTELDLAGGVAARETATDWTGRLGIGVRAAGGFRLGGRGERAQYLNTAASLSTPVMTETAEATLDWARRGWLGRAAASRERFEDDNGITSASIWMLAPIVRDRAAEVHVGYAFAAQSTEESRYAIVSGSAPVAGSASGTTGAYVPYYTPIDLRSHSALGSVTLLPGGRITLRGSGSYGVASEMAEAVVRRSSGPFQPPTYAIERSPRTFHPWTARMAVEARLNALLSVSASAESMHTAFYKATTFRAGVTQTFATPLLAWLNRQ